MAVDRTLPCLSRAGTAAFFLSYCTAAPSPSSSDVVPHHGLLPRLSCALAPSLADRSRFGRPTLTKFTFPCFEGKAAERPAAGNAVQQGLEVGAEKAKEQSDSEDSEDTEYVPHTDDSGEESEVVEMRRHAMKFRKKMKDSRKWFESDSNGAVPIDFIANVEEVVEDMEFESSDEDYSYDEDSDGNIQRRRSKCP
ncbi:hypothetical protein ZWY2020_023243 [Hordeum vulgare]|nr:hypothetical protein ZWY2020_023243 [Hordeum vulgare]